MELTPCTVPHGTYTMEERTSWLELTWKFSWLPSYLMELTPWLPNGTPWNVIGTMDTIT